MNHNNNCSTSSLCNCQNHPFFVRMDSWDEALFELIYDQPIMKTNGKYPYKVNLQGTGTDLIQFYLIDTEFISVQNIAIDL